MTLEADLIASERGYFEAGARRITLPGGVLVHLPAFPDVPAAAVLHRVDPPAISPDPLAWLVALESRVRDLGFGCSRLYLEQSSAELDLALSLLGYRARGEVGMIRRSAPLPFDVTLREIRDASDWQCKLEMCSAGEDGPDGFACEPARWIAFEQAKQQAGYLTPYLAFRNGEPCGAVGVAVAGRLLRFKNLIVAPAHRRRGVGAAITAAVVGMAYERGLWGVGLYAFPGSPGEAVYRKLGFVPVVRQVGYDRPMSACVPERITKGRSVAHH